MKTLKNKHPSRSRLLFERRWSHPLLGFARFLAGAGFWISHVVIVAGVIGVLLLGWFDAIVNETVGTLATMAFGVALLFAFAGWIARYGR